MFLYSYVRTGNQKLTSAHEAVISGFSAAETRLAPLFGAGFCSLVSISYTCKRYMLSLIMVSRHEIGMSKEMVSHQLLSFYFSWHTISQVIKFWSIHCRIQKNIELNESFPFWLIISGHFVSSNTVGSREILLQNLHLCVNIKTFCNSILSLLKSDHRLIYLYI